MTEELFRTDAYLKDCEAVVVAADATGIELDRTVFYPTGGGQPGDTGRLIRADGSVVGIIDTRKVPEGNGILHLPAESAALPQPGERVRAEIDWDRRHRLMRIHTCLHLLCAVVPGGVTGGQIGDGKGRLDFDLGERALDKEAIAADLNRLIAENHAVGMRWISDEDLAAQPELVRTMSVKPPTGQGRVRLMEIADVDLQPCGGTHVRETAEIGPIRVEKIESKGRRNRRVVISFAG